MQHEVGYSTVGRWLHENNFKFKVRQSWPERQNEAERQAFLERLQTYLADHSIDLWTSMKGELKATPGHDAAGLKKEIRFEALAKLFHKGAECVNVF
jgi:hypothetical protein